jgi:hypothetical protein
MDFRFPPLINGRELDGFPVSPPYKWEGTRWISGFPPLIKGRELDGFPVSPPYKWEGTRWISGFPPL